MPASANATPMRYAPSETTGHAMPYTAPEKFEGPRTPRLRRMPMTAEMTIDPISNAPKTTAAIGSGIWNQGLPPSCPDHRARNPTPQATPHTPRIHGMPLS